jgi:pimeloyl-ACP methyl ester carboxylesterase
MKRLLVGALSLFLVLVLGYAAWSTWRDPLAGLPSPDGAPTLAALSVELHGGRRLEHVRLDARGLGQINIVVSLPDPLPNRKLPVVVVLGGLATGARGVHHIPVIGDNVVIGYDWPIPARLQKGLALLRHAPTLHDRVLSIPGQVATVIRWAQAQEWSDASRVSLLGFSLGALAVPAAQRLAAQHGALIGWTVLAYGGAPLGALVEVHPKVRSRWLASALGHLADLVLWPVEPSAHLPHLTGHFLVLEGRDDPLIPAHAAACLREHTPSPKRVIALDGGHMGIGPDQERLLNLIIAESRAWLIDEGAVNPSPAVPESSASNPPDSR